jgi:LysR family transcriptional regulator of gallate degradation
LAVQGDSKLEIASIEPNLRRLRTFASVVRCGSVRSAAQSLHLTQPAVTRAVQKLELELGLSLFERTTRGMRETPFGGIVAARTARAFAHLEAAEGELVHLWTGACANRPAIHLANVLTHRHLQALIATFDFGTQSAAAAQLQLSQPAVTQALNDLENHVGAALLLRASTGMAATAAGEILIRRGKLALAEITAVGQDIAERLGVIAGQVTVGVLPLSGTLLVPRAVSQLLQEHPGLRVTLVDGSYDALMQGLRCGDIDAIVGPLRHPVPSGDIVQERLFDGTLSVIARKEHPLAARRDLTLAELNDWGWVLPGRRTPARRIMERVMRDAGLAMPANPIESNGLATVRALLIESDRLTMISRHQIYFEESAGLLGVLPIDLHETTRPIGITTRADASHSAGVLAFFSHLREVGNHSRLIWASAEPGVPAD